MAARSGGRFRPRQGDDRAELQPEVPVLLQRIQRSGNFPDKVGAANTEGIFGAGDWFEQETSPGNSEFVAGYKAKYGSGPIDSTSAEAYACGQILQAVVEKVNSLDNMKIIDALHQGSWPSVEGNLSWNEIGEPQGQDLLLEWVGGKLLPVYPPEVALTDPVIPKPNWSG